MFHGLGAKIPPCNFQAIAVSPSEKRVRTEVVKLEAVNEAVEIAVSDLRKMREEIEEETRREATEVENR